MSKHKFSPFSATALVAVIASLTLSGFQPTRNITGKISRVQFADQRQPALSNTDQQDEPAYVPGAARLGAL